MKEKVSKASKKNREIASLEKSGFITLLPPVMALLLTTPPLDQLRPINYDHYNLSGKLLV